MKSIKATSARRKSEPLMPEELERLLEQFAVDKSSGGDTYRQVTIYFYEEIEISAEECTKFIQTVIQFLSSRMASADKFISKVSLYFENQILCWPLIFFNDKTLIDTKEIDERFYYTYALKETTAQGELNFKMGAHTERSSHNMIYSD